MHNKHVCFEYRRVLGRSYKRRCRDGRLGGEVSEILSCAAQSSQSAPESSLSLVSDIFRSGLEKGELALYHEAGGRAPTHACPRAIVMLAAPRTASHEEEKLKTQSQDFEPQKAAYREYKAPGARSESCKK